MQKVEITTQRAVEESILCIMTYFVTKISLITKACPLRDIFNTVNVYIDIVALAQLLPCSHGS